MSTPWAAKPSRAGLLHSDFSDQDRCVCCKATWIHKWAILEGHGRYISAAAGMSAVLVDAPGFVPRLLHGAQHRQLFLELTSAFPAVI